MLTRSGWILAASAIVLTAVGWSAGYPELVCLGLAGGTSVIAALGWTTIRTHVAAEREIRPMRVTAGQPARAVLTVRNEGRRRCPPLLAWERVAGQETRVSIPSLGPGRSYRTDYPLATSRRGRYDIEPLSVGQADPLLLSHTRHRHGSWSRLYVHPKTHAVAPLPVDAPRDSDGRTLGGAPRGGVAFHSLRPYEPGDDCRLIHWPSSARTGTVLVRHNVAVDDPFHLVVLDTDAERYCDGEMFEDAVRVAASWCRAAAQAGVPVELRSTCGQAAAVSPRAATARGGSGANAALDVLAGVQRRTGDPGLAALPRLAAGSEQTALGVVTGRLTTRDRAYVSAVRPRYRSVSIVEVCRPDRERSRATPGVRSLTCASSRDFAEAWSRLAAR